jgi:Uma2 family endonuclease
MKRDSSKARRHYSLDDYFMVELESVTKHELYDGDIFAMAGASLAHNRIASNLHALLHTAFRGSGCNAFTSDLRIATPGGLYTYPDVSVICGTVELVPGRPDTATNPVLLVEVLSDATRDYDRGKKFELYKQIPALQEYLTVEQNALLVEHWRRSSTALWTVKKHTRLAGTVRLQTRRVALPLAEIYRETNL